MVARYAGRVADGFICTSGKGLDLYAEQLCPAVDEGLDKAGRDRGDIDRMIEVKVSWDPDPERCVENTRFWAPLSLHAHQKHTIHSPGEMEDLCDRLRRHTVDWPMWTSPGWRRPSLDGAAFADLLRSSGREAGDRRDE